MCERSYFYFQMPKRVCICISIVVEREQAMLCTVFRAKILSPIIQNLFRCARVAYCCSLCSLFYVYLFCRLASQHTISPQVEPKPNLLIGFDLGNSLHAMRPTQTQICVD